MQAKYTYEQLIEKIALARAALKRVPTRAHSVACPVEDPESYAPCNCGASAAMSPIRDAVDLLTL